MNDFERDVDAIRAGHLFEQERRDRGVPAVALEFSTTWCMRHLEPFRASWPDGAAVAMLELFNAFVADARVPELTGGDAMRLAAVVHEWSPLCCFIGDQALEAVYASVGKKLS